MEKVNVKIIVLSLQEEHLSFNLPMILNWNYICCYTIVETDSSPLTLTLK